MLRDAQMQTRMPSRPVEHQDNLLRGTGSHRLRKCLQFDGKQVQTHTGVGFNDARHVVCMLANVADAFEKPHQVFQTLGAMHSTLLA
jgi:hypothetical protein